jgi:hypothetical protein
MGKKLISCCFSSIRPSYWKMVYEGVCDYWHGTDADIELIVAGPVVPNFRLPPNFKYIKTENVKPAQCEEIGRRESQGDFILLAADDNQLVEGSANSLYLDYVKRTDKSDDNLIILSRNIDEKYYRRKDSDNNWRNGLVRNLPFNRRVWQTGSDGPTICGLGMALVERKYFDEIGGIDKRFIGSYWNIDVALRFLQSGIKIEWSDAALFIERVIDMPQAFPRLSKKLRRREMGLLEQLWVRPIITGEPIPSGAVWCHYGDNGVLSKIRLDPVVQEFDDKDIKLYSQGPKEYGGNEWV